MTIEQHEWRAAIDHWLPLVFKGLAAQADRLGRGGVGVLVVTVDTASLEEALRTGVFRGLQIQWHAAASFLSLLGDLPAARLARMAAAFEMMDPAKDVALFLQSRQEGGFTRFVVSPIEKPVID